MDVSTPGVYSVGYNYAGNEGTAQEVIGLQFQFPKSLIQFCLFHLPLCTLMLWIQTMMDKTSFLMAYFWNGKQVWSGRDLTAFGGPTFPKAPADEPGVALALEDRLLTDPISTQAIASKLQSDNCSSCSPI